MLCFVGTPYLPCIWCLMLCKSYIARTFLGMLLMRVLWVPWYDLATMRRCLLGRRPSCSRQLGGFKLSMRCCNTPQGKGTCLPYLSLDRSSCCSADVLLGAGQLNLPRVEARPLTEAHSPDLATKSRALHQHQKAPDPSPAEQGFKAQPLNKKILEGPVHVQAQPMHAYAG